MNLNWQPVRLSTPLLLFYFALPGLVLCGMAQTAVAQQDQTAAEFLPSTTVVYLEVSEPAALIEKVENHPLTSRIAGTPEFKDLLASPDVAPVLLGQALIETKLGQPILQALKTNLSGGLYVALDAKTNGVVVLGKSSDEAALKRVLGTLLNLAKAQAEENGDGDAYQVHDYREAKAAKFNDILLARYGSWFLIANKPELAKSVVDAMIDGNDTSLATQPWFTEASALALNRGAGDARAIVDLKTIRDADVANDAFSGRTDNPGVELIFGGVLDALKNAPVAVANLTLDDSLKLVVSTPFETEWADEHRDFFYGEQLSGTAPAPLLPENLVACISSYRDVAGWWLSKEDLFEENVIAQLAQADSQLSTVFSGMNFGEDVLGALQPGVQIVVAEKQFGDEYQPDIKLPTFALIGTMKDPEKIQPRLKVAFQSAIGVSNLNLGMQGMPQLSLDMDTVGEAKIVSATYLTDDEADDGLLLYNFSPTIAFQGDWFILSSDTDLAIELANLAAEHPQGMPETGAEHSNTRISIDAVTLEKILASNRESLIAGNMIEEGNSRRAAEKEIDIVLTAAKFLNDAVLDYRIDSESMELELEIRVDDGF